MITLQQIQDQVLVKILSTGQIGRTTGSIDNKGNNSPSLVLIKVTANGNKVWVDCIDLITLPALYNEE